MSAGRSVSFIHLTPGYATLYISLKTEYAPSTIPISVPQLIL